MEILANVVDNNERHHMVQVNLESIYQISEQLFQNNIYKSEI